MKLNFLERLMTNSRLRALHQRLSEVPALKSFAQKDSYPLCLEIGAGRGYGARLILESFKAGKVIAAEFDPIQIKKAEASLRPEYRGRIEFVRADAMNLPFKDETFDAVFSFGVVHHMEDWRKAVSEISRVLKPGGEFFFVELLGPFLKRFPLNIVTDHPDGGMFTSEEFREGLKSCGLEISGMKKEGSRLIMGSAVKKKP